MVIVEASDCEIVQLCFIDGIAELISIDSEFNLTHWGLDVVKASLIKRVKIPEEAGLGFASCLRTLGY